MDELYFIAVVPPADIRNEITKIKEDIRDLYGSAHALRSPPHITLHMPFKWSSRKKRSLSQSLGQLSSEIKDFEIELKDFDCFRPRVIFVNVLPCKELDQLQKKVVKTMRSLNVLNADYKNKPFHPHVTVAFRDLRKSEFFKAWDHYQSQQISFTFQARELVLLKHDGHRWNIDDGFPLYRP